ncbi:hypothetical protein [Agromyces seonyuensis]|uniref:Uncharacterized protein n=1 Tax=Agromyces seonyuensis TaxID=2662446 RepID=A0A6I4NU22_9MICO|nr:hypothetical protein [Agromyces seonyuensis]MWB97946.1 hypothetical protein [Agromyces seonyuensis]
MNRLKKSLVGSALGLALVGGSLVAAAPAVAATSVTEWIQQSTKSSCLGAMEGIVRKASYSGYKNIKTSSCIYLSTRKVWEGWVSYTKP